MAHSKYKNDAKLIEKGIKKLTEKREENSSASNSCWITNGSKEWSL